MVEKRTQAPKVALLGRLHRARTPAMMRTTFRALERPRARWQRLSQCMRTRRAPAMLELRETAPGHLRVSLEEAVGGRGGDSHRAGHAAGVPLGDCRVGSASPRERSSFAGTLHVRRRHPGTDDSHRRAGIDDHRRHRACASRRRLAREPCAEAGAALGDARRGARRPGSARRGTCAWASSTSCSAWTTCCSSWGCCSSSPIAGCW